MNTNDLTVVMPVYNGMPFLRASVESILLQTGVEFEFLIINDGSTDGSTEYLDSIKDRRVKVVHQTNKGLCKTLNEGILSLESTYFARLDQDDVSNPGRLKCQLDFLRGYPEYTAVMGNIERIAGSGKSFGSHLGFAEGLKYVDYSSQEFGCIVHSTLMMRCDAFRKLGGYREWMYPVDDYDLLLRIEDLERIAILTAPIIKYRIHGGAGSFSTFETMDWKTRLALLNAKNRRSGGKELDLEAFQELDRRRPWIVKLLQKKQRLGRLWFRSAGLNVSERRLLSGMLQLICAVLCAPSYSLPRIIKMIRSK